MELAHDRVQRIGPKPVAMPELTAAQTAAQTSAHDVSGWLSLARHGGE